MEVIGVPHFKKGSGIHIKKKNRGKFTEYCGGEVTQECIDKAKKSKNPTLRKRATFAENARAWKHSQGGFIKKFQEPAGPITQDQIIPSQFIYSGPTRDQGTITNTPTRWEKFKQRAGMVIDGVKDIAGFDGFSPDDNSLDLVGNDKTKKLNRRLGYLGMVNETPRIVGGVELVKKGLGLPYSQNLIDNKNQTIAQTLPENVKQYIPESVSDVFNTENGYLNRMVGKVKNLYSDNSVSSSTAKLQKGGQVSNKPDYKKIDRTETDSDVSRWNKAVYSQFDPAWGYPILLGAIANGTVAAVRSLSKNPTMQYEVKNTKENKAGDNYWRYRLGLSVDPEHFGEVLDDGSVTLPQYVEREIPTDTTALKTRIAKNEEFLKNNQFTQKEWDIANGLINTDKETLDALRHTYKTGEPVVINEFSYNSRPLLQEGNYTEYTATPLNMLQNYTIQYNPSDNTIYYRDVYDFNKFDKFVPGEAYKINGAVQLSNPQKKGTKNQKIN